MRFGQPRAVTVTTDGVDVRATLQIGTPSGIQSDEEDLGAVLIAVSNDDATEHGVEPIEVQVPIRALTELLAEDASTW